MKCKNSVYSNFMRHFIVLSIVISLTAHASPPETSNPKVDAPGKPDADAGPAAKKLRVSDERDKSNRPEPQSLGKTLEKALFGEDQEDYEAKTLKITEVVKKFDFIASLFFTTDNNTLRKREKEYLRQLQVNIFRLGAHIPEMSRTAASYYIGHTYSDSVEQYRREMVKAMMFIKINMLDSVTDLCSTVSEALNGVKVYDILHMPEDAEEGHSVVAVEGSNNGSEASINRRVNEDFLQLELSTDSDSTVIEEDQDEPSLKEVNEKETTADDDWPKPVVILRKNVDIDEAAGASVESWEVVKPSQAQKNPVFDFAYPSGSRAYREDLFIQQRVQNVQSHYLGRDMYGNDLRASDMKTFLTHIKEGFMPKMMPYKSKLAQAMAAAFIIMQETGMVDELAEEYGVKNIRTKFLMDTLFEQRSDREKYERDPDAGDHLAINSLYEYRRFSRFMKRVHPHMTKGAEDLKLAAIKLALNTFPGVRTDIDSFYDLKNGGDERISEFGDLERVLAKRELIVLVHPKEYKVFVNFSSRLMDCFYTRLIALAMRIIERHYIRSRTAQIRIVHVRSNDPILDLMENKGHMTGLYFIQNELQPSATLFGSPLETMKIPILSHNTYILVHKRHRVSNLEDWHRYIGSPPEGNNIIVTNLNKRGPFEHMKNFKLVSIVLDSHKEAPIEKMMEFNPVAGVFWGIDPKNYLLSEYYFIEFPYCVHQGPFFSAK